VEPLQKVTPVKGQGLVQLIQTGRRQRPGRVTVGAGRGQRLLRVTRRGAVFEQESLDGVSFVPMIEGVRR
jgi:hypothetical protein